MEDESLGISFEEARRHIVQTFKEAMAGCSLSSPEYRTSRILLTLAAIAVSVIVLFTTLTPEFYPGLLVSAITLLVVLMVDVFVEGRYNYAKDNEVLNELRRILFLYETDISFIDRSSEHEEVYAMLSGITHSSICTTYRDQTWHRLPALLVCEGDVIALMAGDTAPARVIELIPDIEMAERPTRSWTYGNILEAGAKILLSSTSQSGNGDRYRAVSADSAELLAISGDIRFFKMLETPLKAYLADILAEQGRAAPKQTYLSQLVEIIRRERLVLVVVLMATFLIEASMRLAFLPETRQSWTLSTFIPLLLILICFIPCPYFYCVIAEVLVTSDLLVKLEVDLQMNVSSTSAPATTVFNPMNANNSEEDEEFFDEEDIEERVEESAAEVSSRLTTRRWILYVFEVARSRLGLQSQADLDIPIPFTRSHLLEMLGAITFVAFVDDDVICEGYSIVEELFLLKNLDATDNKGMVLDLHANATASGSRFENPLWWKHLTSLKPIGLNSLLTYAPSPLIEPNSSKRNENAQRSRNRKVPLSLMESKLISHVRRPTEFESLRELAEEIGFCSDDVAGFTRMLEVNLLAPRMNDRKLLEDAHAWGQEETRRRGTLVPELRGVVARDGRTRQLQMMMHGSPIVMLNYCREYWDGANITSFDDAIKKEVLNVYNRWHLEDFDVVAFGYAPVPYEAQAVIQSSFDRNFAHERQDFARGSGQHQVSVLFYVDSSAKYSVDNDVAASLMRENSPTRGFSTLRDTEDINPPSIQTPKSPSPNLSLMIDARKRSYSEPPPYRPETLAHSASKEVDVLGSVLGPQDGDADPFGARSSSDNLAALNLNIGTLAKAGMRVRLSQSEMSTESPQIAKSQSFDEGTSDQLGLSLENLEDLAEPSPMAGKAQTSRPERTGRPMSRSISSMPILPMSKRRRREPKSLYTAVFPVLKHQVFLGMAASSVPIRPGVSQLMEDLTGAGVRFIYFSPRNMRRSKQVAGKIGIPFEWNCAISLRELHADENDPHRHISSYADWDVHAQMPHGVAAIRRHLEAVDNVPLLVNLYTDATPSSIHEIVEVFREHGEIVMTIGSSYRVTNRSIFGVSDLACAVSMIPGESGAIPASEAAVLRGFPCRAYAALNRGDLVFVFRLVRLNAPPLLQFVCNSFMHPVDIRENHVHIHSSLEFSPLLEAIRTGRIFVLSATQSISFICVSITCLSMVPLLSMLSPLSLPPVISPPIALLFLFVYIPSLAMSLLFTHASSQDTVMKNTPRKRFLAMREKDVSRFRTYFAVRCSFVGFSIVVVQWLTVSSLYGTASNFDSRFTSGLFILSLTQ